MDRRSQPRDDDAKFRQQDRRRSLGQRRRLFPNPPIYFLRDFSKNVAMKRTLAPLLTVAMVLITAHRLPAPIQEVPESPTPAPEQSATPKAKRVVESKTDHPTTSSRAPSTPNPARSKKFAGTWTGTM